MLALITVLCGLLQFISAANLPSFIPRCYRDDPELNSCILKATETLKPRLKEGIPELGMPSLNPFYLSSIVLEQVTDPVNYKVTLTDVEIRGFDDYKFTEFSYDPKTLDYHATGLFNHLILDTNYNIDGKLLGLRLRGKGKYNSVLGPSTGSIKVTGKLVNRKGEQYYEPLTVKANIQVSDYKGSFTGLFGENEELSRAVNTVLNENAGELLQAVIPEIEKVAEEIVLNLMRSMSRVVPYNDLLPSRT